MNLLSTTILVVLFYLVIVASNVVSQENGVQNNGVPNNGVPNNGVKEGKEEGRELKQVINKQQEQQHKEQKNTLQQKDILQLHERQQQHLLQHKDIVQQQQHILQQQQQIRIDEVDDMPLTVRLDDPHLTQDEIKHGLDAKLHGANAMWFEHKNHKHLLILGKEHPPNGIVFLTLFLCMIGLQLGIFYWKKQYPSSYQKVTLGGLLIIPPIISFSSHFYRFLIIWLLFCIITSYLIYRAIKVPLEPTVPKMIYLWFDGLYRFFYGMSVLGYIIFMLDIFGLDILLPFTVSWGVHFLFYGLYFGVMSRDFAEVVSETLANNIGFITTKDGLPSRNLTPNDCVLCFDKLAPTSNRPVTAFNPDTKTVAFEPTVTLTCKHVFHESCIRGWTLIGKKDTCPSCKEKVNLRDMFTNSWEVTTILWSQILDGVRYLVVWNPIILIFSQIGLYMAGVHE